MLYEPGNAEVSSDADVENFVQNEEDLLKARLKIDPLTGEKVDEAQRKAGEREEKGL